MPKIETIKATEAPGIPSKQSKAAAELLNALRALKKDEVFKLSPDFGKSVRGLKTSVGRITKGANVRVSTWDDGEAVYINKS